MQHPATRPTTRHVISHQLHGQLAQSELNGHPTTCQLHEHTTTSRLHWHQNPTLNEMSSTSTVYSAPHTIHVGSLTVKNTHFNRTDPVLQNWPWDQHPWPSHCERNRTGRQSLSSCVLPPLWLWGRPQPAQSSWNNRLYIKNQAFLSQHKVAETIGYT